MDIAVHDMEEWGRGGLGVALLTHYYEGEWSSAASLSREVPLSVSQVRRRLNNLNEMGKVHRRGGYGGDYAYIMTAEEADRYIKLISGLIRLQNDTGVEPDSL